MKRSAVAGLLKARLQPDTLVVTSLGTARRAWAEQEAPQLTYDVEDPMGVAPAVALGFALALPERPVTLLEGDGDLSMNLGVLMTIVGAAPSNLRIVVFQNNRYETGGGQPLPAGDLVDFAAIARGAGFPWVASADNEEDAELHLAELLARPGPAMLVLRVEQEPSPYPEEVPWSKVERRTMFMQRMVRETQRRGE